MASASPPEKPSEDMTGEIPGAILRWSFVPSRLQATGQFFRLQGASSTMFLVMRGTADVGRRVRTAKSAPTAFD